MKAGFIVNPIAGMGGSVGLKGTDSGLYKQALALGAQPETPKRAADFFDALVKMGLLKEVEFLTGPGQMGEAYLKNNGAIYSIIGETGAETSSEDTKQITQKMLEAGIELLIFAGGDGTARDIFDAVGDQVPVIGIPSGVKMFSGLFAVNPEAAAGLVKAWLDAGQTAEAEVMDIDEEAYRNNELKSRLYGYFRIPQAVSLVQNSKMPSLTIGLDENIEEIHEYFQEIVEEDTLYLFGPGSTVKLLCDHLGVEKTLLGIDAWYNGELIQKDINEKDILELFEKYPNRKIVVTPIGGNGFIFGRGSKQFTPQVIEETGRKNILIIASKDKLENLKQFRVDTGSQEIDKLLCGYLEVLHGYLESRMMKVV